MPEILKLWYAASGLLNGLSCTALALFVFSKGPRSRPNQAYCLFALPVGMFNFLYYFWATAQTADEALKWFVPLMDFVVMVNPFFLRFVATITGDYQKKRKAIWLSCALNGFFLLANQNLWLYTAMVPRHQMGWWPVITPLSNIYHAVWFWHVILGHIWLWKAFRATKGAEQQQLKWTLVGTIVGYGGGATNWFLWHNIPIPPVLNILITPFQIIIAYAIVRHQLMDIRVAIRRSLVYSMLIASITASYLVVVLITERWFQGFFGYRSFIATVVVAFLIAIFFNPLRNRIQTIVDRALFTATPTELAAQREQLLAEVRKSDQMKAVGTLAAGLAHEIKNPLTSIKTFTEHLEHRYDDPAFRAKFKRIVGGEVDRIDLIVQQLLDFAKPVPPKLKPLHVPNLIDDTLEFLGSELVEHRVEVKRDYQARGLILGDPQQLKQVFLNLLLNSLQAMNGSGKLMVQTVAQGSELTVTIADNGQGIDPKDLSHIFEPFYTTKPSGTGLGLAVVQGIIREHQGKVSISSQLGVGTSIKVTLPLAT